MNKLKIGFLPFYLELYDSFCPEIRPDMDAFVETIANEFKNCGLEVITPSACRVKSEFEAAVNTFETEGVTAIVSMHLAYSPSLESIEVIANTDLPLIVLDTTPDYQFGFEQTAERIMFNHGIHGVQDFCNLLIRHNKLFDLEVGHWKQSDVLKRVVAKVQGFQAADLFKNSRVGLIGEPFKGMGDFAVPFELLNQQYGIEVVLTSEEKLVKIMSELSSAEVDAEIDQDLSNFEVGNVEPKTLATSIVSGLAVRRWLEAENLTAFSMNFLDIKGAPGLPIVPFLEASKAMARGVGYAGEGDVLTAVFESAIAGVLPETTFTEMFCPDWENNRLLMTHMGEVNPAVCAGKAVLEERPFPFTSAGNPVIAAGCLKPGAGMLLNLAPGTNNTYTLIAAPVDVCDTGGKEVIDSGVRGWVKPDMEIADFLKQYSQLGGTHHLVLSYNMSLDFPEAFAKSMGWNFVAIA